MKITIVQGAFLPVPPWLGGGVEKVWFALGREFARRGHEVTHLSRAYPGLPAEETIDGVRHRRAGGFASPKSLSVLKGLDLCYSLQRRCGLPRADILVTHTFWLPMFVRSRAHGALYVHAARYPKGQMGLYRHAARVQTVSAPVAAAIVEQTPALAARVRMIPNCLPGECVQALERDTAGRERTILYVGRIHPEKGLELLLDAFREVSGWKLRIVGPWAPAQGGGGEAHQASLKQRAQDLDVDWVGPVFDAAELDAHYRRAAIFVYPSLAERGETFGLAPLEAMARGCATVVSDLGCFKDFVRDGENGIVFDHRQRGSLPAQLTKLVNDGAGRRERLGQAGRQTAREYLPERIAGLFLEDFAAILEGGS